MKKSNDLGLECHNLITTLRFALQQFEIMEQEMFSVDFSKLNNIISANANLVGCFSSHCLKGFVKSRFVLLQVGKEWKNVSLG